MVKASGFSIVVKKLKLLYNLNQKNFDALFFSFWVIILLIKALQHHTPHHTQEKPPEESVDLQGVLCIY